MGLSDKQIAAILTWTMMTTFWFFLLGIPGFSNLVQTNSTSIVLVVYPSGIHSTSHVYKHLIGNFMKHIPIYISLYIYIPINIPFNVFQYDNGQMTPTFRSGGLAAPAAPARWAACVASSASSASSQGLGAGDRGL